MPDTGQLVTVANRMSATTIDVFHEYIHQGKTFYASRYVASLASGASIDLLITVGSLAAHLIPRASCGGEATLQISEQPTVNPVGTAIVPVNRNRTSSTAATTTLTHTPTVSAAGTVLSLDHIPGGTGGSAPGGALRKDAEWVLAPAKTYLVRLTNTSGSAREASLALEWYESNG